MTSENNGIQIEKKLADELVSKSSSYYNLAQEIIITTEDKLRIHLMEYSQGHGVKTGWISPLTFFVTLVAVLTTATFRDLFLPSATWQAIFILLTVVSFIWGIWSIIRSIRNRISLNDVISRLKNESKNLRS